MFPVEQRILEGRYDLQRFLRTPLLLGMRAKSGGKKLGNPKKGWRRPWLQSD